MKRILILGASGFLGGTLYRELCPYYDTYGTYFTDGSGAGNQHFFPFNHETDAVEALINDIKPACIISAVKGDFESQVALHKEITTVISKRDIRVIFLSSANVFDAFSNYPSYEYDKTLSESIYGKFKIRIENMLLRLPVWQYVIARLPMVFGPNSPRLGELKYFLEHKEAYEVFPDLVMNVTCADKFARQIHYMINRHLTGIYHLGSRDLIHHDEFIGNITEELGYERPLFKNVYTRNTDRFLAVLPKDNKLPAQCQLEVQDVVNSTVLR
ncbi:sugar nucleotide-binding protein [Sinomicrobium soli]|uniref:sugar nucleotide-binding protein n=1 Tax=Sinomicrobium sp. N-1-3-6 TaxID=2219864 RepID=UPI000DCB7FB8|nr:sugar nucleotide-binding protein [Sinomicrobium sp. N-1-3-6]RAV28710.1 dTDP-4-dehydrorhamnose reductase [Sinomicrobium sp. N-1-3-6]